ncbi:LuxR C-terminal-related transcriptional regulator [Hafnia paralvei]|nr:LuxR C-terminal-related transcriptional regulator [Hafnia paralvei]UBM43004.1 LuxR C-terminal-related transcriptional regulator [Hafnia paralvei]
MLKVLTPEEKKVVLLMNKGLSSVMIATLLNKNIKTVSSYKRSIMRKIGVRSNVQLYRYLSTISVDH